MKNTKPVTINGTALTFTQRLEAIRTATAEAHYDATLSARAEFERRLVESVSARATQVLDAITGA